MSAQFQFIPVGAPDDPRIEPFTQVRERDLVGRRGLFVAEGEVVLRRLVRSPAHRPVAFLCAQGRAERMEAILEQGMAQLGGSRPPGHTADSSPEPLPVYVAPQSVMDEIVGFPIHRGLLGLGRRVDRPVRPLLAGLPERALVVALHGISNHDNMGGIFRNAAAFGVDAVVLDATCCDPLYRKALRVSVGAALETPFARLAPGDDLVSVLIEAGLTPTALSPSGASVLAGWTPPSRAAVLLGAEGPGLPAEVLRRCQALGETLAIPMAPGFDSLNVATTSGIVLHHMAAARNA